MIFARCILCVVVCRVVDFCVLFVGRSFLLVGSCSLSGVCCSLFVIGWLLLFVVCVSYLYVVCRC